MGFAAVNKFCELLGCGGNVPARQKQRSANAGHIGWEAR
jgi:hypothetical protein